MQRRVFILLLTWLASSGANAQQYLFDIFLMNKKIGSATISKTLEEGGKERYRMWSQAAAKVLFVQQSSEVTFDVLFKSGQLLSSFYRIVKEDDNTHTNVHHQSGKYVVNSTLGNRSFSTPVHFTSIQLYFKEPIGVAKIFVERLGDFIPLQKTGQGIYEYTLPDGIKNIFRYRNGILYEMEVKKGMGSVIMRPSGSL